MQLAVLSGKGGTGKTTIVSSFAYLAGKDSIKVDCDVDAANLHLMFNGTDQSKSDYFGSKKAFIDPEKCINCGACLDVCRFDAVILENNKHKISDVRCEGCGACQVVCPSEAIDLTDEHSGEQILTVLEDGSYLSRASLFPGADGSGKLVTKVRKKADSLNMFKDNLIIIDGSPGVGCSVMASITGVDHILLVTEPTQSGFEDFNRILELVNHFGIKTSVVINKFDLNLEMTQVIERYCEENEIRLIGKIPYDSMVNQSNFESLPLVLYNESIAGNEINKIWNTINHEMGVL